jgi:thiol-disulfide isomerase/thioredoxin
MMNGLRPAMLALALGSLALAGGDLVADVRAAVAARNFAAAEREIQNYRAAAGTTPEMLDALSWLARGVLDAGQYDRADSLAAETERLSVELLRRTGRGSAPLANALGAAIEVRAQALAARGRRSEALAFLEKQLAGYRQTPIAARIQKNINLLTLQGKPAPALDVSHWLGTKPPSLAALKGHPVLLFFWAHWCGDCKAEVPVLARLMADYGPRGLVLVGPTQTYGFVAGGVDATPEQEMQYIEQVRDRYYGALRGMHVPVSEENFQKYGCSTTPTLVLLDRSGIVRLYHPGAMSYEALANRVNRLLGVSGRRPSQATPRSSQGTG